eukprot:COSAG01_NODE_50637_length_361_cov_5.377863_2_plen_38_part_01
MRYGYQALFQKLIKRILSGQTLGLAHNTIGYIYTRKWA